MEKESSANLESLIYLEEQKISYVERAPQEEFEPKELAVYQGKDQEQSNESSVTQSFDEQPQSRNQIPVSQPPINLVKSEDIDLKLLSPSIDVSNSESQQLVDQYIAILTTINPKQNYLSQSPEPDLQKKLICDPIKKNDIVKCKICLTNMIQPAGSSSDDTILFSCGHRFCRECSYNHLRSLIAAKNLDKLVCPNQRCGKKVAFKQIKELFKNEKELIEQFQNVYKESRIDMMTIFCVNEGCEGRMQAKTMSTKKMTCPTCQTLVCFQCREAWHGYYISCETAFNTKEGGSLGNSVVWCTVCRKKNYKHGDNVHITCSQCGYEFCYLCKKQYPCAMKVCFKCGEISILNETMRYILLLVLLFLTFMCIPMFIVLAFPVGCWLFLQYHNTDIFCATRIINIPCFSLCWGCIFNVFAIPLGLLVGPFFLIYFAIDYFSNKMQNLNQAREKIKQQKLQQDKDDTDFLL